MVVVRVNKNLSKQRTISLSASKSNEDSWNIGLRHFDPPRDQRSSLPKNGNKLLLLFLNDAISMVEFVMEKNVIRWVPSGFLKP